ncbi:hypothetical protein KW783_01120 [Candidatus Parcubacteria bacterium]|nr:hypothetical protein [Candidatus Parcubacteria bacterium]
MDHSIILENEGMIYFGIKKTSAARDLCIRSFSGKGGGAGEINQWLGCWWTSEAEVRNVDVCGGWRAAALPERTM